MTDKKVAKLINAKEWNARRELMQIAQSLMRTIGTDVYMDYNVFVDKIDKAAKQIAQKPTAAQLKTIARAMSVTDSEAAPVIKKIHKANIKDIQELTDLRQRLCRLPVSLDHRSPVILRGLARAGISIARQIDQIELIIDQIIVNCLRLSRCP